MSQNEYVQYIQVFCQGLGIASSKTISTKDHLPSLLSGHSCSLRSQRRSLPPTSGGATQDRGRAGLQCDGRQGAELPYLHLPHHPRRRGWEAGRPKARGSAPVRQWRGRSDLLIQNVWTMPQYMDRRESADKLFYPYLLFKPASKKIYPWLKYFFSNFSQNWYVKVWYVSQQSGTIDIKVQHMSWVRTRNTSPTATEGWITLTVSLLVSHNITGY